MTSAYVLNGPNLNLLGMREPEIYGTTTLADVERSCLEVANDLGWDLEFRQTNREASLSIGSRRPVGRRRPVTRSASCSTPRRTPTPASRCMTPSPGRELG